MGRSRDLAKALVGPLLFIFFLILPPLPWVSEAAAAVNAPFITAPQVSLGILLWIASWWITEYVPLGLTALLAPLLFTSFGLIALKDALRSFMDPIIWIFMGGFVLAKAFQVWNLDKRIAFYFSTIYKGKSPMLKAFSIACLPTFMLTITGSITAATSLMYPIVLAYLSSTGFNRGSKFAEATMLALGQAATAGAMFLLISTPPNLVAKKVVEECFPNVTLTFFDWFIVGSLHAFLGLIISWLVVFKVIKIEVKEIAFDIQLLSEKRKSLGPMSKGEKLVFLIFLLTLTLWLLPGIFIIISNINPQLEPISSAVKNALPEALPAVLALFLLGLLKADGRRLLTWEDIETGIDWNVIFLFGGGIAMGKALEQSGFSQWLVLIITQLGGEWIKNPWVISALSAFLGFLITYPASNTVSSLIACPLAATLARGAGINPIPAIISAALASSISSALPSTTPPMAIVYGSRYIKSWNMFKVGMISDLIRLVLLITLEPYLADILLMTKGLK
ncbi:MAG: DASS family sodium-coupled anion symporter [Thermoproteales archaeon]|nr:DASS family sodium-coupled anion symporter [Thermoproteales archaeon]RLE64153.1 MAG: hypothetical protein DRJ47_08380 [Thermoprotei archaeon]